MERIKQALERAREGRPDGTLPTFGAAGTGTIGARQEAPALPETGIVYQQTRVVVPPAGHLQKHRVLNPASEDETVSAYKVLRTQVLDRLKAKGASSVGITSPGPGQGKTLTAINLAITLAAKVDYTVLLVDFDLRRPSVHKYLGLNPQHGIADCMFEDVPLPDVLINPGIDRLVVLPGKEPIANSSEMLASPRMKRMVAEMLSRYQSRIVIFDLPPLLMRDDAMVVGQYVENFVMVVAEGETKRRELAMAAKVIDPTRIIGTVLNRSRETVTDHY